MDVTIFGTGYVSPVTGTCLADVSHVDDEVKAALPRDVVGGRL